MSPAGGHQPQPEQLVEHVTCLGCGCTCDDITVHTTNGRIVEARRACALGLSWFGDGVVPGAIHVNGAAASLDGAVGAIADLLGSATRPLVYLAPELSCEAQRRTVALADLLHASLDTVTSATALPSILAAQERGRAGATLGEIRNRADVLVFWGVDPTVRYPRYWSRYAPEPAGLHIADGRRSRTVIAVDIGEARGPDDADLRVNVDPAEEVALLTAVAAIVRQPGASFAEPLRGQAASLATRLTAAHYAVLVADAEPPAASAAKGPSPARDPQRASALIALTQALNGPTRAALSTLRGGGNRSGADTVLTAHTGYPTAVSFLRGAPVYEPRARTPDADAVLIVGDAVQVPSSVREALIAAPTAVIGPRASEQSGARVAIDTGMAGIHAGGTVLRLDDVPLPLRPSLPGPPDPVDVMAALIDAVERSPSRNSAATRPWR